jgi:signal peptidase I
MCEENKKKKKYSWKAFWKDLLFWFIVIIISIILATGMRVLLLCSFKVPSYSMHPAIEPGDFIMVNKQIPGPRVYRDINKLMVDGQIATKRFKGIRAIKRNDIIVFNFPYSNPEKIEMNIELNYVKRCVAIPGDTFYIENGFYKIKNAPTELLGCLPHQEQLSEKPDREFGSGAASLFPYDTIHYRWTMKNFGPFYIPKKGDNITIDTVNFSLYHKLIAYEANKLVTKCEGAVFIGDSIINRYTFQMNYYFMAGDYLFNSVDSRYWGLVPEDHIIGKAFIIWKAQDMETGKIKWGRIVKLLR